MKTRRPHPVPITLDKFKNPKVTPEHWQEWRERQLERDRHNEPVREGGRAIPVRYDE